ncbi:MAG: sigma-70 family RNA polymerase sigma factor [Candidatus Acidiferrales bacterium]
MIPQAQEVWENPAEEDAALVARVLGGDRRAFEPLIRRHERRVYRVTLAVLGNTEDAEEAMQDAFVKAYRHLGQFRQESKFTTWLTRIAINEALQKKMARKANISLEEVRESEIPLPRRDEPWRADPEKLYGRQEMKRLVESAIQSLDAIYRQAFVLRDVENMSAQEAAEAAGIAVAAMKSRVLRARLMVREALAAKLEEPLTLKRRLAGAAASLRQAVTERLPRAAGR